MVKAKTAYECAECGGQSSKWQGQCPHCFQWNSLNEVVIEAQLSRFNPLNKNSKLHKIDEVNISDISRNLTNNPEFDRVLGGGLVPGGVTLIGGDPGIGKSTILIQTLAGLTNDPSNKCKCLYISGEESIEQIAIRAKRLDLEVSDIFLLSEINLSKVIKVLEKEKPDVVVVDSIQTMFSEDLTAAPGSVSQVRECSAQLTRVAKSLNISLLLVGHVTKEGSIAGPRVLEHIVDTVLYFEGETNSSFRLIRAIKNRYGSANELGIFAMTEKGLKPVTNPSAIFLSSLIFPNKGSVVTVIQEGTRPLLVEIQALVDISKQNNPKRLSVGLESNRIAMIIAILNKHLNLSCHEYDVFVNAVGGVKISETGADLAILIAIASSLLDKSIDQKLAIFGEVGLGGEVRPVVKGQERLNEAIKLGFEKVILPKQNMPKNIDKNISLIGVSTISDAIKSIFKL